MTGALTHLPILQVILPLAGAPLCGLVRHGRMAWALAMLVSVAGFAGSLLLFGSVHGMNAAEYDLGGWPIPIGIALRVDTLAAVLLLLLFGVSTMALVFDAGRGPRADGRPSPLYYATWLLLLAGFTGIIVSADLFNIFVFLEISSLAGYVLIAAKGTGPAIRSALNYLFLGSVGATFYLIGVGMLFIASGGLALDYIAAYIANNGSVGLIWAGTAFLLVGLAIKAAVFPLHGWLPGAYTHAPDAAAVFISATSIKVALYILYRAYAQVLLPGVEVIAPFIQQVLMVLAGAAVITGSVMAIRQADAKTLLAYSSVAHVGYIVVGLALLNQQSLAGGVLHMLHHGLAKGALFLAVGAVSWSIASTRIEDMAGIARHMPVTFAGVVVAGLGLVGVPLTGGFVSKFQLILGALEAGAMGWLAIVFIAVGSVLALAYVWRLLEPAYFGTRDTDAPRVTEAPLSVLLPLWILIAGTILLGVLPAFGVNVTNEIAATLLGVGGDA